MKDHIWMIGCCMKIIRIMNPWGCIATTKVHLLMHYFYRSCTHDSKHTCLQSSSLDFLSHSSSVNAYTLSQFCYISNIVMLKIKIHLCFISLGMMLSSFSSLFRGNARAFKLVQINAWRWRKWRVEGTTRVACVRQGMDLLIHLGGFDLCSICCGLQEVMCIANILPTPSTPMLTDPTCSSLHFALL